MYKSPSQSPRKEKIINSLYLSIKFPETPKMKIVNEIGIQEIFIPKNFIKYCGIPTTEKEIEVYKEIFDSLSSSQGVMTPKDLRLAMEKYGGFKPKRQLIY